MRVACVLAVGALAGCGTTPQEGGLSECRQSLSLTQHDDEQNFTYASATCRAFLADHSGPWQATISVNNKPSFGEISNFSVGGTTFELNATDLATPDQKAMLKNAQKGPFLPLEGGEVSVTIHIDPKLVSVDLLPIRIDLLINLADD